MVKAMSMLNWLGENMVKDVSVVKFICKDCGHIWDEDYKDGVSCMECESKNTEELSRTRY